MSLRHVSDLCMAKGHTFYCGLVHGPHVGKGVTPNRLNYCVMCIVCAEFTDVAAGSRPHALRKEHFL